MWVLGPAPDFGDQKLKAGGGAAAIDGLTPPKVGETQVNESLNTALFDCAAATHLQHLSRSINPEGTQQDIHSKVQLIVILLLCDVHF